MHPQLLARAAGLQEAPLEASSVAPLAAAASGARATITEFGELWCRCDDGCHCRRCSTAVALPPPPQVASLPPAPPSPLQPGPPPAAEAADCLEPQQHAAPALFPSSPSSSSQRSSSPQRRRRAAAAASARERGSLQTGWPGPWALTSCLRERWCCGRQAGVAGGLLCAAACRCRPCPFNGATEHRCLPFRRRRRRRRCRKPCWAPLSSRSWSRRC